MKGWFAVLAACTAQGAVLIVIAITLPSGASLAQGTRAQRMACAGDVWRLCSSAIPSVDRIVTCLKRERARLSPGCQTVFNDAEAQATINRPPPGKATPHAQPEQAASTAPAPAGSSAAVERPNIVAGSLPPAAPPEEVPAPGNATPHAQPEQAASTPPAPAGSSAAAERPNIVARSLPAAAPPEEVAAPGNATPHAQPEQAATPPAPAPDGGPAAVERPNIVAGALPAAAPEEVASAKPPALSGVGQMAVPTEQVGSRDVDSMTPVNSRHGRQQREAYYQSSHRGRSGNRYGGVMEEIAPLIAMAMGGHGGFDSGSIMRGHGGRGNFDIGQMMGMARSVGFDPSTFMGGGGGDWR